MIKRFIRFVIEDPYPIGFLSGIIIARSFWFPWWGYGPAVYLLALLMLAPLAAPRITARMAIEIPRSRSASHPSARRHSGRSVANRQLSGGSFPAVATHGQEMPVTAASKDTSTIRDSFGEVGISVQCRCCHGTGVTKRVRVCSRSR